MTRRAKGVMMTVDELNDLELECAERGMHAMLDHWQRCVANMKSAGEAVELARKRLEKARRVLITLAPKRRRK